MAIILRGPLIWFESTPLGRLLNRFSQDVQTVDCDVMNSMVNFNDAILGSLQIIFVIALELPRLLPLVVLLILITHWIARQYILVSREMKRLESISRSPVLIHFSETYLGLSTIRSFAKQEKFMYELFRRVDDSNRTHLFLWVSNRWLNIRMSIMGSVVVAIVGGGIWFGRGLSGGSAGLVLLYSLSFTDLLTWVSRTHAEFQMNLNAVERIKEYSEIAQERYHPGTISKDGVAPEVLNEWPSSGRIEFRDIHLAYFSGQVVLKGVSFIAEPGEKVGIVGRSGAGKSSCITALLRLAEPSSGSLLIDGVDVLHIPLEVLRSRIAVVPQHPILFEGSIRSNLDPLGEFLDEEVWRIIHRLKLTSFIESIPGKGLEDKHVEEKGRNLSSGQRQLLCMARAMLKGCKVFVMDEATASVDTETDALIQVTSVFTENLLITSHQDTIKHELSRCTVLCVAHRLHTIASYDKVIVMNGGQAAEAGRPLELMLNEASLFRKMCVASGDFDNVLKIARAASSNGATAIP